MSKSHLKPFLRKDMDILFVGLNPAKRSHSKRHYFSVNQAFWDQLYRSELLTQEVDKNYADGRVFGGSIYNYGNWNYGIVDLVRNKVESNSRKIKPTESDVKSLIHSIIRYRPKVVILLHKKVLKSIYRFIGKPAPKSNVGFLGKIIPNCGSVFFAVGFPHGGKISSKSKISRYKEVKRYLLSLKTS